jgi:phage shock protein B
MDEVLVPIMIVGMLFIGLPWLVMHYVTRWKTAPTLTNDDEQMLGDMHELARRLEDRLETVERLVAADNPDWQPRRMISEPEDTLSDNIRKLERNR